MATPMCRIRVCYVLLAGLLVCVYMLLHKSTNLYFGYITGRTTSVQDSLHHAQPYSKVTSGTTTAAGSIFSLLEHNPAVIKDLTTLSREHHQRVKHVEHVCDKYKMSSDLLYGDQAWMKNLYVDDKHQVIYCYVPKVACTNWKRVMLVLSGNTNVTRPEDLRPDLVHNKTFLGQHLRSLDTYADNRDEVKKRIQNYYSFMFVREPTERVLSAYYNKFTAVYSDYFKSRYGRQIIKHYRSNATQAALEKGDDVKLHEFVQYLIDPKRNNEFNEHWRPYHQQCRPCAVHYSAIGKYEHLSTDVQYVMREAGIMDTVQFPDASRPKDKPSTKDLLTSAFVNVTQQQLVDLWNLYSIDFDMFNYSLPESLLLRS